MKYWHLESYLNHAGDSIKVSLERKLTLIQVNEKTLQGHGQMRAIHFQALIENEINPGEPKHRVSIFLKTCS